jgi:SM-20-related protein
LGIFIALPNKNLPFAHIWFYAKNKNINKLDNIFDSLINSFIETKVGITENFLSPQLAADLKANLQALYADQQLQTAGIGNDSAFLQDKLIRNDKIYWLDRAHNDVHENAFFDLMDSFVSFLNKECYTGITSYEFHYALYEKGSFYKKHLDQFQSNKSRAFSMIMYLNTDWEEKDGGELCIYHDDAMQMVSPTNGKCVFFKSSELLHEVLLTHKPRLSITGWLKH